MNLCEVIINKFYPSISGQSLNSLAEKLFKLSIRKKTASCTYIRLYSGVRICEIRLEYRKRKIKLQKCILTNGNYVKIDKAYSGERYFVQNEFLSFQLVFLEILKLSSQREN